MSTAATGAAAVAVTHRSFSFGRAGSLGRLATTLFLCSLKLLPYFGFAIRAAIYMGACFVALHQKQYLQVRFRARFRATPGWPKHHIIVEMGMVPLRWHQSEMGAV